MQHDKHVPEALDLLGPVARTSCLPRGALEILERRCALPLPHVELSREAQGSREAGLVAELLEDRNRRVQLVQDGIAGDAGLRRTLEAELDVGDGCVGRKSTLPGLSAEPDGLGENRVRALHLPVFPERPAEREQ